MVTDFLELKPTESGLGMANETSQGSITIDLLIEGAGVEDQMLKFLPSSQVEE